MEPPCGNEFKGWFLENMPSISYGEVYVEVIAFYDRTTHVTHRTLVHEYLVVLMSM